MATHSSILAWRIPWTEEPGGPQSRVAKSRIRLSDFTFTLTFNCQVRRLSALVFAIDCFLEFSKPVTIFFFKLPVF